MKEGSGGQRCTKVDIVVDMEVNRTERLWFEVLGHTREDKKVDKEQHMKVYLSVDIDFHMLIYRTVHT